MPVRTQHGRGAIYRRVWGAPLRSQRRLLAVLVALALLVTAVGLVWQGGSESPTARDSAPSIAVSVPFGLTSTATAFGERWVSRPPGITSEQWVARLRPYTEPAYWSTLETVDPANIPASRLTLEPRVVAVTGGAVGDSATVDVPTDALILRLILRRTTAGWRVASYSQAG